MKLTRVSVVVATWNRPLLVTRLVAQLEAQDFPAGDYEIVVVDDGSEPAITLSPPSQSHPAVPRVRLLRQ